jgi:hypothetical protein
LPDRGKFARNSVGTVTFGIEGDFLFRCTGSARRCYFQDLGVCGSKACGTLVDLHSSRGKLAGERLTAVAFHFERLLVFDLSRLDTLRGPPGSSVRVIELCSENGQFTREGLCSVSLLLEFLLKPLPLLDFPRGAIGGILADVRMELISNGGKVALKGVGTVTFGGEGDFLFRYSVRSVSLLLELPFECLVLLRSRSGSLRCF